MSENISKRSGFSIWMQAARPFAYSASVIPLLVGAMIALAQGVDIMWGLFPVVVIAGVLFHTATNFVSEYFDFKKGVDRKDTYGSSRVLVDGLLKPANVLWAGIFLFAVGFALGLILVYFRGTDLLILGVIGLIGGLMYTGGPLAYKYFALGDIFVFALMGPLMVIGSYMSLTGVFDWNVLWISLPIGFLVTAILHANNIRDRIHDSEANIKTLAMILGLKGAKIEYYLLIGGAYASIIVMVAAQILAPWALIVFLSLPPALKNIKEISAAEDGHSAEIAMLDVKTAQHHMLFGLLLTVGLVLTALI